MIYQFIFRHLLTRMDAENAHKRAVAVYRLFHKLPGVAAALRLTLVPRDPAIRVHALGLDFPSPLGVAAGMDKDVLWFDELGSLGFGFVEVGTITKVAQDGNSFPRVWRLVRDRALLNSMGFPNPGAAVAAERLSRRSGRTVVGVNIGKSKDSSSEDAENDYRICARAVAAQADFLVLNVSSPNTPGLRDFQAVGKLRALIDAVREETEAVRVGVPLLIKIAPDLADDEIDDIAALAVECRVDGIVAVNTTIDREQLVEPSRSNPGGVSGAPLRKRAIEVLERLHARVPHDLTLISVGGIDSAEDVLQRVLAGATLVQAHTGFIYGGPLWPHYVNRQLAALVRARGVSCIEDLRGLDRLAEPGSASGLAASREQPFMTARVG